MKYLLLSADYNDDSCLRHEFSGEPALNDVVNSPILRNRIVQWNQKYFATVLSGSKKRPTVVDVVSALDNEGITLARTILSESMEPIKIKYYSEQLMRFIAF